MMRHVESQRVRNVFNWGHSFGTHQVNTALMNMTYRALTLSTITNTTMCVATMTDQQLINDDEGIARHVHGPNEGR